MILRPAKAEEVAYVASRLRPADAREVTTATGLAPEVAFADVFKLADTIYTLRPHRTSDPAVLLGLSPESQDEARVWLVGTREVHKVSKDLLREAPCYLEAWAERYTLTNIVDSRNLLHIKWLTLMGFAFGDPRDIRGVPFYPITYCPKEALCVPL